MPLWLAVLALGLIAVTVGAHLNVRRLRNAGRRLSVLLISEATITPLIVYVALRYVGGTTFEVLLPRGGPAATSVAP